MCVCVCVWTDPPRVAVRALAHLAPRRVVTAALPIGALGDSTGPGGYEFESFWQFTGTFPSLTLVFGHCKPRGIFLAEFGVGAGRVGALVMGAAVEEVIATRLQTPQR